MTLYFSHFHSFSTKWGHWILKKRFHFHVCYLHLLAALLQTSGRNKRARTSTYAWKRSELQHGATVHDSNHQNCYPRLRQHKVQDLHFIKLRLPKPTQCCYYSKFLDYTLQEQNLRFPLEHHNVRSHGRLPGAQSSFNAATTARVWTIFFKKNYTFFNKKALLQESWKPPKKEKTHWRLQIRHQGDRITVGMPLPLIPSQRLLGPEPKAFGNALIRDLGVALVELRV